MLKSKLQQDQIQALKSGEKNRLDILRYVLAKIKNKEIEKKGELNDDEVINILRRQVKELQEAKEAAQKANRQQLVEESQKQLDVVNSYLPKEISDEELKKEIEQLIERNQEIYTKNPKAIIGIAVKELRNKANPSRIIKIVQSISST